MFQAVPGASCSQYELAAVLIHRGTSASHGHYGEAIMAVLRLGLMAPRPVIQPSLLAAAFVAHVLLYFIIIHLGG